MTNTAETLDQIQVFWSILLLPTTIILNVTAFIMLLKSSGSCLKDPIISPLLSVIGFQRLRSENLNQEISLF